MKTAPASVRGSARAGARGAILLFFVTFLAFPFYWMLITTFKRTPDLLIAVKRAVDEDRKRTRGRFVLTGSANLLMLPRVGETLAGRAVYVTLWAFTRRERLGLGRTGPWNELLGSSFREWPEVLSVHGGQAEDWREEYPIRTVGYLVRDEDHVVSIAQEVLPETEGFRAVTHIPRGMVQRIDRLVPDVPGGALGATPA